MHLYVMRHGPAEDRAPSGRDFDRALTHAGREVVARAAKALHDARSQADPRPLRVIASPFRRARETAEIVAATVQRGGHPGPPGAPGVEVEIHDDLGADAGLPLRLVEELSGAGTDALLVGHQPTVEALVGQLVHPARSPIGSGFRTGLIVALAAIAGGGFHPAGILDPYR